MSCAQLQQHRMWPIHCGYCAHAQMLFKTKMVSKWRWKWEVCSRVPDLSPVQQKSSLTSAFSPGQSCWAMSLPQRSFAIAAAVTLSAAFVPCPAAAPRHGTGLLLCSQSFCFFLLLHSLSYITPSSAMIFGFLIIIYSHNQLSTLPGTEAGACSTPMAVTIK